MREENAREQELLSKLKNIALNFAKNYKIAGESFIEVRTRKAISEICLAEKMTLDLYGILYGTDKASADLYVEDGQVGCCHDYLRHYERFFAPIRGESGLLIEFGCYKGASIRMWEEYFQKFNILGVDLVDADLMFMTDRVQIFIGDATTKEMYAAIDKYTDGKKASVIIDDASHAWGDQRRTLELFWDMLAPGGVYIIEDLECGSLGAYEEYIPDVLDSESFFDYIRERCSPLRWPTHLMEESESSRLLQLPPAAQKIEKELDSCQLIPGAVILQKKSDFIPEAIIFQKKSD